MSTSYVTTTIDIKSIQCSTYIETINAIKKYYFKKVDYQSKIVPEKFEPEQ